VGTPEIVSLSFSIISLVVAAVVALQTYRLSRYQLHIASRHEFLKLLIDIDKELIRDPMLWAHYDNHPLAKLLTDDPVQAAKLEAFAYLKLNLFNMVFEYAREARRVATHEVESFDSWDGFCQHNLANSRILRAIIQRPEFEQVYGKAFAAHVRTLMPVPEPSPVPVTPQ
jgi:hypothetical protein